MRLELQPCGVCYIVVPVGWLRVGITKKLTLGSLAYLVTTVSSVR